eukprot:COSAG02_NODE_1956_length_10266_cov_30.185896_3_plen_172_part_00
MTVGARCFTCLAPCANRLNRHKADPGNIMQPPGTKVGQVGTKLLQTWYHHRQQPVVPSSIPSPYAHLFKRTLFNPFCLIWRLDSGAYTVRSTHQAWHSRIYIARARRRARAALIAPRAQAQQQISTPCPRSQRLPPACPNRPRISHALRYGHVLQQQAQDDPTGGRKPAVS